jgi:hypothetical protein
MLASAIAERAPRKAFCFGGREVEQLSTAIPPLSNTTEERTMGSRRINAKKKIKRRAHSENRKAHEKVGGDKVTEVARNVGRPTRPMGGR